MNPTDLDYRAESGPLQRHCSGNHELEPRVECNDSRGLVGAGGDDPALWIATHCKVIRSENGLYAFALIATGARLTKFAHEYFVACKRMFKLVKVKKVTQAPPAKKVRVTAKPRLMKSARPVVKRTGYTPKKRKYWVMLPGHEMGICVGGEGAEHGDDNGAHRPND